MHDKYKNIKQLTETAGFELNTPALFLYSHRVFPIKAHYKAADGIASCPRLCV